MCDASGLNPNVMFELGMRLTFNKPTVIVVDDSTKLPFDTSIIEHIQYPVDLHFSKIEKFMKSVSQKIVNTLRLHNERNYKPYLDTFGAFTVVEPEAKSIKFDDFVVQRLDEMAAQLSAIRREQSRTPRMITVPGSGINALLSREQILTAPDDIDSSPRSIWTEDKLFVLREMWEGGENASQIADMLGEEFTRNAVIGKAHRLGLDSMPAPKDRGK